MLRIAGRSVWMFMIKDLILNYSKFWNKGWYLVHYRRKSESLNERWKKVVLTKYAHSATYSSILWFWELILFNSTLVIMYRPNNIYCSNKNLTATQGHLLFPLSRKASFFCPDPWFSDRNPFESASLNAYQQDVS